MNGWMNGGIDECVKRGREDMNKIMDRTLAVSQKCKFKHK